MTEGKVSPNVCRDRRKPDLDPTVLQSVTRQAQKEYVSADEAWKEYKKVYFQGKEELADGFTDNPLANSAHYQVYLNDVSMQDSLVTYIKGLTGVREVKESAKVANTLTDFNKLLGYVSGGIILILLCVAVFLISNTVTVGISVRKEEIAIMKLIGATDFLVRAPFIVEGIVFQSFLRAEQFFGSPLVLSKPMIQFSIHISEFCEVS